MALFGFGSKGQLRKLVCRETGMDCGAVFTGNTDDEVLKQASEHAEKVLHMKPDMEMAAKFKKLIRNA